MKKFKNLLSVFLITILISLLSGCVATVSVPEIKEGRFDFSVTYSVNGELNTYKGVYVCEYDGVLITCVGASIEWKGYIENAGDIDIPVHTNKDGVVYINLGFYAEYFMDDPSAIYYNVPSPRLAIVPTKPNVQ